MSDDPIGRRFVVRGRVQGVGFRYFVFQRASFLGVAGWVKNNRDGTVEVEGWGSPDQLAELEAMIREGPRSSSVDGVDSRDVTDHPEPPVAFSIRGW